MKLIDILIIAFVALLIGLVVFYIHRSKKKGIQCIGCPDAKTCSGNCAGCAGNCGSCK